MPINWQRDLRHGDSAVNRVSAYRQGMVTRKTIPGPMDNPMRVGSMIGVDLIKRSREALVKQAVSTGMGGGKGELQTGVGGVCRGKWNPLRVLSQQGSQRMAQKWPLVDGFSVAVLLADRRNSAPEPW